MGHGMMMIMMILMMMMMTIWPGHVASHMARPCGPWHDDDDDGEIMTTK